MFALSGLPAVERVRLSHFFPAYSSPHLDKSSSTANSADKYPYELSGGMQQRVALARAFAMDTDILLMDEPFGAIDPLKRQELQELSLQLCKNSKKKKTIIFITHDIDEALILADKVYFMTLPRTFPVRNL